MAQPVTSAGRPEPAKPADLRRAVVREAARTLRRADAADYEVEEALEALLELAKE